MRKEESLQIAVAKYLKLKYPRVIFHSDFASGCKLTIGQAMKNKSMQCGKSYPDMFIAEPRKGYCGLYLELKKDRSEVYLKDGSYSQKQHIQEQLAMLGQLRQRNYKAEFACGIDEAMKIIDEYLKP